ncbi:glucan biosynthesis protein [Desulfatitalea alkaliphila]|uniref:Glucan biosynthesis protein D n=1 Tax=Desulfatitalea alkaliphila TaxID=2929485 RepID=A0AA41R2H5_9BACT|nr:glucan biosynthesis protein D [Desulfatitalea alkaliphila]MCJ8501544.1 glucan biosynthesis protein D [Desulfatitalea alkaliphila]
MLDRSEGRCDRLKFAGRPTWPTERPVGMAIGFFGRFCFVLACLFWAPYAFAAPGNALPAGQIHAAAGSPTGHLSASDKHTLTFGTAEPFSFDALKAQARTLAARPYQPPAISDADLQILDQIGYDQHNRIRFRASATLWGDSRPGPAVRFFHPGRYFKEPVALHVLEGDAARRIHFARDLFDIPEGHPARKLSSDVGFAGFRVLDEKQERDWMAFLGASYFRTSGPFDQFGLSARGLAIDTATAGAESFPRFSRFWLARDGEGGLVTYALLEGAAVTGAYRIASRRRHEEGVVQEIEAALYLRGDVQRLGIAPLTSMFWYGKPYRAMAVDWRPEIHDSDGLAIWTGAGEHIWRPLNNPPRVMVNAFLDKDPKGFGLMQRERDFEQYQDDGVFYEKRPSLWVEPLAPWGGGAVQLVEIPTNDEVYDNIGAFWVPAAAATAGREYLLRYRLHWVAQAPVPVSVARVMATRTGNGGVPGRLRPEGVIKFVVDFDGRGLEGLDRDSGVAAVIEAGRGKIDNVAVFPVVGTSRWRAMFDLDADGPEPVDLRMFLRHEGKTLSETWVFQHFPE